jgi:hypothetical protein
MFDANHERKRKEQLIKLYNRTPEQIEEEQNLVDELKKIEQRKKEREKKTQDLQKLITAADANTASSTTHHPGHTRKSHDSVQTPGQRPPRSQGRKKIPSSSNQRSSASNETSTPSAVNTNLMEAGIKFPDIKNSGPSLRSLRMKLPASVGQKKTKAIEQLLTELNIELRPIPTEEICNHFNELRSDMVLLYELKMALANCEFELQTLKHQYEAVHPTTGNKNTGSTTVPSSTAGSTSSSGLTSSIVTSTGVTTASLVTPSNAPLVALTPKSTVTSSTSTNVSSTTSTTAVSTCLSSFGSTEGGETSSGVTEGTKETDLESQTPSSIGCASLDSSVVSSSSKKTGSISEVIDVTTVGPVTPNRKRRLAAIQQETLMKKVKKTL